MLHIQVLKFYKMGKGIIMHKAAYMHAFIDEHVNNNGTGYGRNFHLKPFA